MKLDEVSGIDVFEASIRQKKFYVADVYCDGCDEPKQVDFFTDWKKRERRKALLRALHFQGWGSVEGHPKMKVEVAVLCPTCALKISLENK